LVQVLNIAPSATEEQLRTLFGYLGRIDDLVLYPTIPCEVPSKVAYLRFHESENPGVAMHLNNTVFIDRALIVLTLPDVELIPDEMMALRFAAPPLTTAGVLPRSVEWPVNVVSMVVGRPGEQIIQTLDLSMPSPYPALPATTDANRIEEIRRTVLITNLDSSTTGEQVLEFMQNLGEIKFLRMAQSGGDHGVFVEFADQQSVAKALDQAGATLNGRQMLVQHATCCIIKPASVYGQSMDSGSKKAKEAQDLINGSVEKMTHSRSRSRGSRRRRSRSRSRDRRRRSSRSRDRDRDRRRRSSRDRSSRDRSRDHGSGSSRRKRDRSQDRDRRRRRSRSRSQDRKKRSRRSKSRDRSDRKRSRSRSADKDRDRDRSGRSGDSRKGSRRHGDRRGSRDGSASKDQAKDRRAKSKERGSGSSKDRRASSKERHADAKDRRASSKERGASAKERGASTKERDASPVKERRAASKERDSKSPVKDGCDSPKAHDIAKSPAAAAAKEETAPRSADELGADTVVEGPAQPPAPAAAELPDEREAGDEDVDMVAASEEEESREPLPTPASAPDAMSADEDAADDEKYQQSDSSEHDEAAASEQDEEAAA